MRVTASSLARVGVILTCVSFPIGAQEPEPALPPADRQPQLVLSHSGPAAPVTALAFGPNGTLYVGGFDKQVRRYQFLPLGFTWKFVPAGELRLPIAPGTAGVVNALAVSPDGQWIAVAGRAPIRDEAWAGAIDGLDVDVRHLPPLLRRDVGVTYFFSADPKKAAAGRVLRGPPSEVRAIAFANPAPASGPVLVTAGIEWSQKDTQDTKVGTIRVFDVTTGKEKELASRSDLPATRIRPGLAAWATGANRDGLRVAVAWDAENEAGGLAPSKLLTWDLAPKKQENWEPGMVFISPLAVRLGKDGNATTLLSGGWDHLAKGNRYGLWSRPAGGGEPSLELIKDGDRAMIPTAIAAFTLPGGGDATALLLPNGGGTDGPHYELRLLTPTGTHKLKLKGFGTERPVLAASPDGRFIAVAGFADNHVEVYESAGLGAAQPEVQKLAGDSGGFGRVAFLAGGKLWLGKGAETPATGGVILDPDSKIRTATPRGPKDETKLDTTGGTAPEILPADPIMKLPARVTVVVDGVIKTISLPDGEKITAAAFLPAKPAWDVNLGPILAVAHLHVLSQTVRVTLYDVAKNKVLIRLGGATLPLRSLAFSGSQALLAGAGDDGTVLTWPLKNATRSLPAIEGLLVAERAGEVVVVSIQEGSPAEGKLKINQVIESVADAKGKQKAVKVPLDFHSAILGLKVGDNAQIQVKGQKGVVAVPVGTTTAFRHPLFALWVDPVAKNGKHDWVAWTSSGPYDTNSEAAETRIGWLAATGNPSKPTTYAPAEQYRKLYYTRDFLRLLLDKADYADARDALPKPARPTLEAHVTPRPESINGSAILREKPQWLKVALTDLDTVLDPNRLELRWQIDGPDGTTDWRVEAFKGGSAAIDLRKHVWRRGEYRVHVRLLKTGEEEEPLVHEKTVAFEYVPPAPELTVKIDGKEPQLDLAITTEQESVEITATVDAKGNPKGVSVWIGWTGSGNPIELNPGANGTFTHKLTVKEGATTLVVMAKNRDAYPNSTLESRTVEARVVRLPKKGEPKPTITLQVITPHDDRTYPDQPYVVGEPKVTVIATITGAKPDTKVEFLWEADKKSTVGEFEPKTNSQKKEFDLKENVPLKILVRAKSKDSPEAVETVEIRYDSLPEVAVTPPPALVTAPELRVFGGLKQTSQRQFRVRLLVTQTRTGRTREFDATPNLERTRLDADIVLFPGENELGYAITSQDNRELLRRPRLVDVRYVRPPVIAGTSSLDVGTGVVGTARLVVVSPADLPPTQLILSGGNIPFRAVGWPIWPFEVNVWELEVPGVAVPRGPDRLQPIPVLARNADGESAPAKFKVVGQAEAKIVPPTLVLKYRGSLITPDQILPPVGEQTFKFLLEATSESRLTKVEVWHGGIAPVKLGNAVATPDGLSLTANPELLLRPGPDNRIRVIATNETSSAEISFLVSYTPPAVRVVLESIKEPKGVQVPFTGGPVAVASPVVEVEGSIQWDFDDDPLARDDNLTAIFIANGVAHLPQPVPKPVKPGVKERKFRGPVFLNGLGQAPDSPGLTQLRVELHSAGRPMAIPQNGLSQSRVAVSSTTPFQKQRLHLLVIGVGVSQAEQSRLVTNVVQAVGGSIPKGAKTFSGGRFDRPGFDFAYLYSPQLEYARGSDLNGLLNLVRSDIEDRFKRPGEEWVNDVIVVYYQGKDWRDEQGRWFLHSATTVNRPLTKSLAESAIRLDTLPLTPGIPVALVNVTGRELSGDTLLDKIAHVRASWESPDDNIRLLLGLADAIKSEKTFGGVVTMTGKGLTQPPQKPPVSWLTSTREMGDRYVGLTKP